MIENERPLLQNEIRHLTSENVILLSRIRAKEEKMSRNERLIQQLSAQLQDERQQMEDADETDRQEIHNFATHCANGEHSAFQLSQRLTERMDHVQELCYGPVQQQVSEKSIPVAIAPNDYR